VRGRVLAAGEIVLVADGPLAALPFEALVTRAGPAPGSARFWLDDGPPLRYAPSASFLLALAERSDAGQPEAAALSVSDPAYGNDLPRLPGTAHETEAVRRALDGVADVVTLDRAGAREPAVRRALAGKRFVHLATHGIADRRATDLFAALALTPPPGPATTTGDDGLLELHEIYELDLDADLVVLSSCASNVGRSVVGEGVFALARGFLVAGAGQVVASQWPVDDDATAELVGRVFAELARGRTTTRALRDAKLALRRTPGREHPFFWAPFVLTGRR
jgi:CHAT domain-containing protein